MENPYKLRTLQKKDNALVALLVRDVLVEMGVPKVGSAYEDETLNDMFTAYNNPKSRYYVVEHEGEIIGCGGVAPLDNFKGNVCELQKMYLRKEARRQGLGKRLINACLEQAKTFGYDGCYLETMPNMEAAQNLYLKQGFEYVDSPMGCTGHSACPVYMYKEF